MFNQFFLLPLPFPQYVFTLGDMYLLFEMHVKKKTKNIFEFIIYYNVDIAI
jgi:hypothetical protein